jgi:glyoxylase-like metal-dependent hydrolase (beta-lactamase superfamily II)
MINMMLQMKGDVAFVETYAIVYHLLSARPEDVLDVIGPTRFAGLDVSKRHEWWMGLRYNSRFEKRLATTIGVDGSEPIPDFRYIATPGHSIDHASIMFEYGGERAFFWGDILHHPLQLVSNSWNSGFCKFPNAARSSRRKALDLAADTNALVFTTHFPGSSVGHVRRDGDRHVWQAVQGDNS